MSSPKALPRLRALCTDPTSTTILVFYRGEWCPFCSTWARGLSSIRELSARLSSFNARVIFVSSQPVHLESEAARHFRFTSSRGLGTLVHFVNDPTNDLASYLRSRFGDDDVVCVDEVDDCVGAGVSFPHGMLQPGVVSVYGMFGRLETMLDRYMYDSKGDGGVDGEDDRPQACTTLRRIEQAHKGLQCP